MDFTWLINTLLCLVLPWFIYTLHYSVLVWFNSTSQSWIWGILSNIAVVISAPFIFWQVFEARRATEAQAISAVYNILQSENVREAREIVFSLKNIPHTEWTEKEIKAAKTFCSTYDVVGIMTRKKLLSETIIIDSWGVSLRNSGPILLPFIKELRNNIGSSEYWDDYERLVKEALAFKSKNNE